MSLSGFPATPRPLPPPGAAPRPRWHDAWPPQCASAAPNRRPPCQSINRSRSPSSSTSSFSHGTEPNPVGDMLSPKIGVTVTVYSPLDGNTCLTSMPPRVPNGSPSMWYSCDVSSGVRYTTSVADVGSPIARRLIFPAADTYASTSVDEMPSVPAMLSNPCVESSDGRY